MKKIYFLLLLLFLFGSICRAQQISRELKVITPGTLATLSGFDKTKITDLALTGTINTTDFQTIREMSVLKNLNLSNVNLVNDLLPNNAFKGKALNKVILPKTLKTINSHAFSGSKITNELDFSICTNLQEIGSLAFERASIGNSNTLDFSKNLKLTTFFIDPFLYYEEHIILPENLKTITSRMFNLFTGSVFYHLF